MKKIALIFLICIYTLATMGFSITQFYCCGKVKAVSVAIIQPSQEKCDKGNDKSGCCKTKFQFFKVGENHFASNISISPDKYFSYLSLLSYMKIIFPSFCKAETINKNHAPPLYCIVPAYIFNCVFRI